MIFPPFRIFPRFLLYFDRASGNAAFTGTPPFARAAGGTVFTGTPPFTRAAAGTVLIHPGF